MTRGNNRNNATSLVAQNTKTPGNGLSKRAMKKKEKEEKKEKKKKKERMAEHERQAAKAERSSKGHSSLLFNFTHISDPRL
jgi:hypothetical protein